VLRRPAPDHPASIHAGPDGGTGAGPANPEDARDRSRSWSRQRPHGPSAGLQQRPACRTTCNRRGRPARRRTGGLPSSARRSCTGLSTAFPRRAWFERPEPSSPHRRGSHLGTEPQGLPDPVGAAVAAARPARDVGVPRLALPPAHKAAARPGPGCPRVRAIRLQPGCAHHGGGLIRVDGPAGAVRARRVICPDVVQPRRYLSAARSAAAVPGRAGAPIRLGWLNPALRMIAAAMSSSSRAGTDIVLLCGQDNLRGLAGAQGYIRGPHSCHDPLERVALCW
jgi:hypothetical protein